MKLYRALSKVIPRLSKTEARPEERLTFGTKQSPQRSGSRSRGQEKRHPRGDNSPSQGQVIATTGTDPFLAEFEEWPTSETTWSEVPPISNSLLS